jgi:hypothetical protein
MLHALADTNAASDEGVVNPNARRPTRARLQPEG